MAQLNCEVPLGQTVAKHYNLLEEKGKDARKDSRIYHLRNFNNWIKSVTIADIIQKIRNERQFNVLDIGCGKGGDLLKYKKANITHIVCADIAETSVKQCEERYNQMKDSSGNRNNNNNIFTAEFITADCTREQLRPKYKNQEIEFDLVSIQFSFHYCFESLSQARQMIQNVSDNLRPGGMFIGTTPDSQEIIKRLRKSESNMFGNSVYSIKFEDSYNDSNVKIPTFGAKYDFHLEGVVDCPEFLVYFPIFIDICREYGLKLVYRKNFDEIFNENKEKRESKQLMNFMAALEVYSKDNSNSLVGDKDDYNYAEQQLNSNSDQFNKQLGTLSQSEWDVILVYIAFCFQKLPTNDIQITDNEHK
ncbi:mRNA cap guanine-N7 methyltransferase-like, partial [Oppia nitens]|uniref:mRNA cap guanine-N7 methyltransferase-like n=1 Tax=Oppia nitens TaxID=1686743 RepID=UPI0023DB6896